MMRSRHWYTGFVVIFKTAFTTFATFSNHRLKAFVPFVGALLLGSVVLWLINAIAPLAPFVYSLF
mgnify:CR=1 FL=1|jgi:hypothetical protein